MDESKESKKSVEMARDEFPNISKVDATAAVKYVFCWEYLEVDQHWSVCQIMLQ